MKLMKIRKAPLYQYERDYSFVEVEHDWDQVSAIKILTGPYAGIIYYYQAVKIAEDDGHGAIVKFTFQVHTSDTIAIDSLANDLTFHTVMGEILSQIITDNAAIEAVTPREHFDVEP